MCVHTIHISVSKTGFSFYVGTFMPDELVVGFAPQVVDAIDTAQV